MVDAGLGPGTKAKARTFNDLVGNAIIFDGNYEHGVSTITKGVRFSIMYTLTKAAAESYYMTSVEDYNAAREMFGFRRLPPNMVPSSLQRRPSSSSSST